jgi:hypothetical protein
VSGHFVPTALRRLVRQRAEGRCEYCRVHEDCLLLPHEPDHIIAARHGGETSPQNLALACYDCNRLKGPNIASADPQSREVVRLFDPRRDRWAEHFRLEGVRIVPLTPEGRATVLLLELNSPARRRDREFFRAAGRFLG